MTENEARIANIERIVNKKYEGLSNPKYNGTYVFTESFRADIQWLIALAKGEKEDA